MTAGESASADKVAKDYVYIGARVSTKDELMHGICIINEDGTLEKPIYYSKVKKFNKTVGGIYRGAKFNENSAFGLAEASWTGRWKDSSAIMEWEAHNHTAHESLRARKMEKEAGRITLVEQEMLTIRRQYQSARSRNDYAAMEALETLVMRALRTPPRKVEQE